MTEIDTSRERVDTVFDKSYPRAYNNLREAEVIARALLARAEKAEAERDTAWNDAIEAAAGRIDQTTQMIQQEMTLRAQRFAAGRRPDFNDAFHRADLDARISCRDQVRALRKGEPT